MAQQLQQALQQDAQDRHVLMQGKQAAVTGTHNLHARMQQQQAQLKENAVTIKQLQDAAADLADELQAARSTISTLQFLYMFSVELSQLERLRSDTQLDDALQQATCHTTTTWQGLAMCACHGQATSSPTSAQSNDIDQHHCTSDTSFPVPHIGLET